MSLLGSVAAAVTFFITDNPKAAMWAYAIGSGVEAMTKTVEGPQLEDLKVQLASYGAPIPFEWGTNRHAGTIIWPKELVLTEHERSEGGKGGPEMTVYTYSCSAAVLICEGPIKGVRRIWANKKLVYDASVENTGPQKDPAINGMRIYTGTETQQVDPLIEATDGPSPAYLGHAYIVFEDYDLTDAGNRPPQWEFEVITAGSSDLPPPTVFDEHYGAGAYDTGAAAMSADIADDGSIWLATMEGHAVYNAALGQWQFSPTSSGTPQIQQWSSGGELMWAYDVPPQVEWWDTSLPEPQLIYPIKGAGVCSGGWFFVGRNYPGYPAAAYAHGLAVNCATRTVYTLYDTCAHIQGGTYVYWPSVPVPAIDANKLFMAGGNGIAGGFALGFMPATVTGSPYPIPEFGVEYASWSAPGGWTQARPIDTACAVDFDGLALQFPGWALRATMIRHPNACIVQGSGAGGTYVAWVEALQVTGFDLNPPIMYTCTLPGLSVEMPAIAWDAKHQTLWAVTGVAYEDYNALYAITRGGATGLTATFTGYTFPPLAAGGSQASDIKGITIDSATGYLRVLQGGGYNAPVQLLLFDPITQTVIERLDVDINIGSEGKLWDVPEHNKVIFSNGIYLYSIPYGVALAPVAIPLSTIVSDICVRSGLETGDIDVTQLTDLVDGYVVSRQMTARAAIEPLQKSFYFDAVESDNRIKFVKRGGAVVATIPLLDRAAHDYGSDMPDNLTINRAQEFELPVQVDVEYPDINADHLIGNQYDRRITKDNKHKLSLQMPVVMTAQKAKQVAIVNLYAAWQTETFSFKTSRKYAHLEPTDIVALPTSEANYIARLVSKREQPGGLIEWSAQVEEVAVYTQSGAGASPINYSPGAIYAPGTTILEMLDAPILRDTDNDPGYYVAAGGTSKTWPGAQLYRSADSGATYEPILLMTTAASIGTAQSVLPDFTLGNIFDAGSSVTVLLQTGASLTSATEEQVLNGANIALIGAPGRWEVIQFKSATLIAENTYQLSGLLRGRRGTEWATGTHEEGDTFILANLATWKRINAGDMGLPRIYKAPPLRTSVAYAEAVPFTDSAVGLKPFAPVDVTGKRDNSNNLSLAWSRRSRLTTGTLHAPVPLGEAVEAYAIDIVVDGVVVRTLSSSAPTVTYTAADQTADDITPGDPVTVRIYQLSATVGRGYAAENIL